MSFSVKVLNYIHLILTFQKMPVIIVKNSSKTKLQRSKPMLNRLWLGRRSGNSGQCKNLLPGELSGVGVHEEEAFKANHIEMKQMIRFAFGRPLLHRPEISFSSAQQMFILHPLLWVRPCTRHHALSWMHRDEYNMPYSPGHFPVSWGHCAPITLCFAARTWEWLILDCFFGGTCSPVCWET